MFSPSLTDVIFDQTLNLTFSDFNRATFALNYRENQVFSKPLVFIEVLLESCSHSFKRVFMFSPSLTDVIFNQTLNLTFSDFNRATFAPNYRGNYVFSKRLVFMELFLGSYSNSFKRVFMFSLSLTDVIFDQTLKLRFSDFNRVKFALNYRENYVFSKRLVFMELFLRSCNHSFKRVFMFSPSLTDVISD